MVITSYSPITSVVYLIATFVLTAIYLSSQNIVYIALTYIIVYVGAVITLFLFVVMMINLQTELTTTPFTQTVPLTIIMVLLYTILIVNSGPHPAYEVSGIFQSLTELISPGFLDKTMLVNSITSFTGNAAVSVVNDWNQIQSIGFELYTHQAVWLVLVSIVLIISIIGPIIICLVQVLESSYLKMLDNALFSFFYPFNFNLFRLKGSPNYVF